MVTTSTLAWDNVDMKSLYSFLKTETEHSKRCTKCERIKCLEEFNKHNLGRKGRMSWCKVCWSAYAKQYNSTEEAKEKRKAYKNTEPGRQADRRSRVVRAYGQEALLLDAKRSLPGAACKACGSNKLLRIDHCHASNKVRDILCHNCNVVLGLVRDDSDRLRALAAYLESWAS